MKSLLFAASFVYFTLVPVIASACENTERTGAPVTQTPGISICRSGYELLYRPEFKTAYWSAEHIEAHEVKGNLNRGDKFRPDPMLPNALEAQLSDYSNSGYARGHLSPAGNFQDSPVENDESFYLSNMIPQVQRCNNSGVWSQIERVVRDWAAGYGELYVVTGPLYTGEPRTIGRGVRVPDGLFKVVYNPKLNQKLGFVVPNTELCQRKPRDFFTPVAEIEEFARMAFFPRVQAVQAKGLWQ